MFLLLVDASQGTVNLPLEQSIQLHGVYQQAPSKGKAV